MKLLKPHTIIAILCLLSAAQAVAQTQDTTSKNPADTTKHIYRAWTRITFQMKRFDDAVSGYVKAIQKAKPADTGITGEVEAYSDSLQTALSSDSRDTLSMARIKRAFDSLVVASVRLVKKVESDTSLRNNKTIKQLNNLMNNLKDSIRKYENELEQQFAKKEDAEPEGTPQPEAEPEPEKKK